MFVAIDVALCLIVGCSVVSLVFFDAIVGWWTAGGGVSLCCGLARHVLKMLLRS